MKTDELIDRIAAEPLRPPTSPVMHAAIASGLALGSVAAACWVLFGTPLPAMPVTGIAPYAMKLGITLAIFLASAAGLLAAGTPGRDVSRQAVVLAFPFVVILVLAGAEVAALGPAGMGPTWLRCLLAVGGFGSLATILVLAMARRLAPTRPGLAGFFAGTAGGGLAASAYGIWCPETEAQFLLLWYALPILALGIAGAAAGRRWLRW